MLWQIWLLHIVGRLWYRCGTQCYILPHPTTHLYLCYGNYATCYRPHPTVTRTCHVHPRLAVDVLYQLRWLLLSYLTDANILLRRPRYTVVHLKLSPTCLYCATSQRPCPPTVRPINQYSKMFVGGLSWDTTDEGLRKYFSEFGEVEDCTILRDQDGRSRGFAFLTFKDPSSVNAVMCREHVLDGKTIDPKRAIPREEHLRNTRYFVGGLSPSTTSDSMRAFFSQYGKVVDCTVMVDRESGRSKGFGFVTFEDASNTEQLVGQPNLFLDDKQVSSLCR
ncbi:RNA-binding domain-containing protein [Trametes coccinea BRFM310]|uniref:RNA-binding domain-containing protein n=1 Tax=Trametes coccinea (strain BRFM310) TaxID=1353009 RepID=A0A1Y2IRB5_TRAC3|nr:RNA-binding domain-containing protein [Trametes coccinea BRFM310]